MTSRATSTTTTISKFTNTKLGQNNYALWAWGFRYAAMAADLWGILDGSSTKPVVRAESPATDSIPIAITAVTQEEADAWARKEAVVINQLAKCVDEEMKSNICTKDSAKYMRDCLKNYHLGKTRREKYRKK